VVCRREEWDAGGDIEGAAELEVALAAIWKEEGRE
jgi:hypothetical protein